MQRESTVPLGRSPAVRGLVLIALVACSTYRAFVGGAWREADPEAVAGFVGMLHRVPIANLAGIVWFRLPVAGDPDTWSDAVFASVLAQRPRAPSPVSVTLRPRGGDGYDIVASDPSDAAWSASTAPR
jgi:hypothetical protein